MSRLLVLVCLLAALSACGFRPRASLALAEDIGPVKVVTADPYSAMAQGLSVALERAGALPAVPDQPSATLQVRSESMTTRPLSVDATARVREYETRYELRFDLTAADGTTLVPEQAIVLRREYIYDAQDQTGSPAEQELIQDELRRDMQAAILRRLDAALRAK
jgi:outer membrane lipopolysaccharide assembly protein LptE/RlpB